MIQWEGKDLRVVLKPPSKQLILDSEQRVRFCITKSCQGTDGESLTVWRGMGGGDCAKPGGVATALAWGVRSRAKALALA